MDLFGLKKSTDFPVAEGHGHPLADDRAWPGTPGVSHFDEPSPTRHCDGGRRSSRLCPTRQKRDSDEFANPGSQVLKIEILKSLRTKRAPGACPNPGPQKVHLDPGSQVLKVEVLKVPIVAEGHGHPLVYINSGSPCVTELGCASLADQARPGTLGLAHGLVA